MARNRKAKGKKKQQPSKRKQKASRPRRAKMGMNMAAGMQTAMGICSVTNPFCPEARGARWPDNSYTKSVGLSYQSSTTLSSDANGKLSSILMVGSSPLIAAGVVTGDAVAYTNSVLFPGISAPSAVARFRLTSYGVRIFCVGTKMNTQGQLRLRLFSPLFGNVLSATTMSNTSADSMIDVPLSRLIDQDMWVIPVPLGHIGRQFIPDVSPVQAGAIASWQNPGWQVLQVAVDGGQVSTAMVGITIYYNYEYVFDDTSTMQLLAAPPPDNSLVVQQGSAGVLAKVGGFVEGSAKGLDNIVKSSAFKWLGAAAGAYFGGADGAMTAYNTISTGQSIRKAIMVD
jgi:hypothetical protein